MGTMKNLKVYLFLKDFLKLYHAILGIEMFERFSIRTKSITYKLNMVQRPDQANFYSQCTLRLYFICIGQAITVSLLIFGNYQRVSCLCCTLYLGYSPNNHTLWPLYNYSLKLSLNHCLKRSGIIESSDQLDPLCFF